MTTDTHTLHIEEILDLLPHRFPFLLVDRVLDFEEGKFLRAVKNVSLTSHFPRPFPRQAYLPWCAYIRSDGAGYRDFGV